MNTDRRVNGSHLVRLLGDWRTGPLPTAYAGLASRLRLLILDGRIPLHTRIPAERELADALGVSRTTVAAAYERLREDGFLRSRRGAGTWTHLPPAGVSAAGPVATLVEDDDLIDLAHAAPPAPAEWLHAAAECAVTQLTRYLPTHGYDPLGLSVLRTAIASRYTARGAPTTPDQVLVTGGAQHAFALTLRALASPGDRIVVEHPTYPNALEAVRRAGCRPVPVPLGPDGWDLEMLAATIRHTAPRLAYLVPDFQNPTGFRLSADDRVALVELAARTGTTLVIDETVAELWLDGGALPPVDTSDLIVTTGSTSKTFWGGLRVGWLRASPTMVRRMGAARASMDLASPILEQLMAADLVPRTEEIAEIRRVWLRGSRARLRERLKLRLPSWTPNAPAGGLGFWVDLGAPIASALAISAERQGVALAAGPRFGLDGAFERYVRLPYTLEAETLDLAVDRLAAAYLALGGEVTEELPLRGVT
ncbi:PLP-dependent aminotransferase family protein [Cryptosporangium aurantiacum]|uniref:Transcriptional regulator, GntR family n=1 Tax=Cryptosporangium aurantiacum TaxID=134849 RepID=A0A1M7QTZ2_9ACTN|nr:PLP-dependent aminotransferase family protein [Cryptosporangium aurantiacum]SHN34873.1 transcriptional regulator, GntR family [Cryptosporangium aurantiacum]